MFFATGILIITLGDLPNRLVTYLANTMNAESSGPSLSVSPLGKGVTGQTVTELTLSDGHTLTFSSSNGGLSKSIETLGANGTTKILSNSLVQLAEQLLEEEKIDEYQAELLKRLANKGHDIAGIEALLEQAAKNGQ